VKKPKIHTKTFKWSETDWRGIIALALVIGAIITRDSLISTLAGFATGYYFRDKLSKK